MAVAFDAVGPAGGGGAKGTATPLTWAHINSAAGNAILVEVSYRTGTTSDVTAVSYGGVALSRLGQVPANNVGPGGDDLWGKIGGLPTGSNTVSVTFGTATADFVTGGSISLTGATSFGTAVTGFASATSIAVNVTGTTAGNMIVAAASFGNSAAVFATTSPGTQRWAVTGDSNEAADNSVGGTWPSPGGTQAVGFSVTVSPSDFWGLVAVEVKGAATAPTSPVALMPLLAPGWFPGSAGVTQDPGGIPFYAEPAPTDATPAVIIPPTPEAAGLAEPVPLPPGWFPGSEKVTSVPGGTPFAPVPPPLTPPPAVIFPVPEAAGEVQWLPWPPGYFPGSQAVAVDPGGIPFYSQPQPLTPPPAPLGPAVISGLSGGGTGYFTDQYGSPRLVLGDAAWGLPANAGRWTAGDWQGTYDAFLTARAAQGFTVIYTDAFGSTHNGGVFDDGRTWDGLTPFASGGDPSTGLNNAFWARIDYLLARAASLGITIFLNLGASWDMETAGYALTGKTTTQFQDYGTAMASRYKGTANLIWMIADDYFGNEDPQITAMLAAMRAAGDTHPIAIENFPETVSTRILDTGAALSWGTAHSQFNFVYSYNVTYFGVETAWTESSPVPVIWGDGTFYSHAFNEHLMRNLAWWALSSGARGMINGDEAIWQWPTTAAANTTTGSYYATQVGVIRSVFEGLAGWHLLIPDTSSALVTAGRGTRATSLASGGGGGAYSGTTDAYVTASRTPDGSLAVIYLSHGSTITIDQTKLGPGYTATWIDPVSGATSAASTGATYNSTAKGNNSAGDPDWVLVFQGPPASPAVPVTGLPDWLPLPPGWFPGSDRVTGVPGGIPFWVIPQPADQAAAPAGTTTTATATLAAAGAVAAVVTEAPIATVAGAGAVAAVVTQSAGAAAAAAGAVAAVVTEIAGASLPGAGAVTDAATQAVTASLAGAGAVTDVVTEAVTASLAGAGAVSASVAGGASTATITGAGAVTAAATQAATATAAGAGAVAAVVTQAATASLAGAGSLSANGAITGTASLAGAGAVTAKATQAVTAAPAAAGALTALAAQRATAALTGAATLTAAGSSAASIVNATSSPSVAAGRTSAPAVTGNDPATAVTSKATSSPAVSDG